MSRPADVLNLENWKVTVPVRPEEVESTRNGKAWEVSQPGLAKYSDKQCFFVDGGGVVMQVHHGDPTTEHSPNPRCELRETVEDWKGSSGTHTLVVEGQVNRLTKKTRTVGLAQVHGDDDYITVFRLENTTLYVTDGDDEKHVVTHDFALRTRYTLKIEVRKGHTRYWYNGEEVDHTVENHDKKNYFKAGNYLQSNKESAPHESKEEYSEVVLYSVTTSHSDHG